MKRLLLPLLLLLISGCKYGSQYEAMQACKENWAKETWHTQYCQDDNGSRKVLGMRLNMDTYKQEVKKRFAY